MYQSEIKANTCSWRQARENAYRQVTLANHNRRRQSSDWLIKWREIFLTNNKEQQYKTKAIAKLLSILTENRTISLIQQNRKDASLFQAPRQWGTRKVKKKEKNRGELGRGWSTSLSQFPRDFSLFFLLRAFPTISEPGTGYKDARGSSYRRFELTRFSPYRDNRKLLLII